MIILSVGNNTLHLQDITTQLNGHGFKATWTNFPDILSTVYNGRDLDLVCFGQEINPALRLFVKKIFSVQNPAIIFVDGLAPIPSLIVEQMRHSAMLAQGRNGNPLKNYIFNKKQLSLALNATEECRFKIDLYQLSPFYKVAHKTIVETTLAPGNHTFEINKKDKQLLSKSFVVVKANNKPWFIEHG